MVVGSFSTNFYGERRPTKDADLVIEFGPQTISQLAPRISPALRVIPQMSFETATGTTRHEIDVVGTDLKVELFHLSDDEHDQERFRRRKRQVLTDHEAWLPTPEDVIITKLRWADRAGRKKDRNDLERVIALQHELLDWDYIHTWADRHGTRTLLDQIRASIPPL
jgi:hypothetical protein